MTRFEPNLRIPGPTALPPTVREAGGRQMVNHRGDEFKALTKRIEASMKPFFGTEHDVILLTCAGTGGLEAAVVNTLSPGDPVLAVTMGAFGDRFATVAEVYGADVTRLQIEWGRAPEPAAVRDAAAAIPGLRAVLLTHNETSTAVTSDIAALAAAETATLPRFYLDLRRHRDSQRNGESPWTPAVAVMFQVDEGIRLMEAEGDGVFARHAACAAMTRAGLRALGFELLADDAIASKTVTAAWIPDGLDWRAFNGGLKRRGLVLAGGQGKLKGRIFRLGHLGSVTTDDVIAAISAIEAQAIEAGLPVQPGAGVSAAQATLVAATAHAAPVAAEAR